MFVYSRLFVYFCLNNLNTNNTMKYDVFISYSSKDQKIVEALSAYFKQHNIRCFVAYRDIPKGVVWAKAIIDALEESHMMVVVFSDNFNKSDQVDREIELASEDKKPILTFKISNTAFSGAKKYYLKNLNWIDAFPNPREQFGVLVRNVGELLGMNLSKIDNEVPKIKVKFLTDTDCRIFIDNEEKTELKADEVKIISLYPGEYIAKFQSLRNPLTKENVTITLTREMTSKVYNIRLLDREQRGLKHEADAVNNKTLEIRKQDNVLDCRYDVILESAGAAKLQVVKTVMDCCDSDLREAKTLVDESPSIIKRNISLDKAKQIKFYVENVGGKVSLLRNQYSNPLDMSQNGPALANHCDVILVSTGAAKLQVLKLLKECTGLGLKESKDLVDNVPSLIMEKQNISLAKMVKNSFEEAGAKVILKL